MHPLQLRFNRFWTARLDQSRSSDDLWVPFLLFALAPVSGMGVHWSLVPVLSEMVPGVSSQLYWKLSLVSGLAGGLAFLALWPLVALVLACSAILLWDRDFEFRLLLQLSPYGFLPVSLHGIAVWTALQIYPIPTPSQPTKDVSFLFDNTVLGVSRYSVVGAWALTGLLMILLVERVFKLELWQATLTVLVPVGLYLISIKSYQFILGS